MRQGSNNRRSRGRNNGRRGGVPNKNQTFESSGPESHIRIRGNASQVHEKYMSLARDAMNAGERILAENFYQHAEHYYRVVASMNETSQQPSDQPNNGQAASADASGEEWKNGGANAQPNGAGGQGRNGQGRGNRERREETSFAAEQPETADFATDPREGDTPSSNGHAKAAPVHKIEINGEAANGGEAPEDTPAADGEPDTVAPDTVAPDAVAPDTVAIERQARPRRRSRARQAAGGDAPAPEAAPASEAAPAGDSD